MRAIVALSVFAATLTPAFAQDALREKLEALEDRWTDSMRRIGAPGFSVAVVNKDGIVYSNAFGIARIDPEKPFTADTSAYMASVTKVYVTLAVMQLVEQGKVDLDAPVRNYLPQFGLPDEDLAAKITIRDLLCHRYGINAPNAVFHDAYTGQITDEIFFRELKQANIKGSWGYTNTHFTILGRVIEAVSGETWRDYLAKHVFEPAGMTRTTGYASELYAYADAAMPLRNRGGEIMEASIRKTDETMHAAGGLGTSANDMARWLQIHLNDGKVHGNQIISPESLDEILTKQIEAGTSFFRFDRPEMGLGWYLGRYADVLMVHHFGGYAGASAHCSFLPDHGIGVAVLTNTSGDESMLIHHVAADVFDLLLGEDGERRWRAFTRQSEKALERASEDVEENASELGPLDLSLPLDAYVGTYVHDRLGTMKVVVTEDYLSGSIGNVTFDFYSLGKDEVFAYGSIGRIPVRLDTNDSTVEGITFEQFWGGGPATYAKQ